MKRLAVGLSAEKSLLRFSLFLFLLSLIAAPFDPARATEDDGQAADTAVQLFVAAANATGLPITQAEATIITQIVTCGTANNANVGDCAKNAAIKVILQEAGIDNKTVQDAVAGAVGCLGSKSSSSIISCAAQTAASLANLPPAAQPAISCMLGGGTVADCGKKLAEDLVLNKVPPEIQSTALCALNGGDAKKCAADFITQQVVGNLPKEVQGAATQIVGCLGQQDVPSCVTKAVGNAASDAVQKQLGPEVGGLASCASASKANLAQCAADFASKNLPAIPGAPPGTDAAAKAILACVGATDFGACTKDQAKAAAINGSQFVAANALTPTAVDGINAAMATIAKLKPGFDAVTIDAGVTSGNVATLQNILMVADGIKTGNMGEILVGGGTEIAIAASNIILSIFLTPAVANMLSPAVAAMIHNDEAAGLAALKAIKDGDPVALAQVLFTWYETQFIDKPCALLGKGVQDAVCGPLSGAITTIANAGGDVAHAVLGLGEDVLKWLGVWGTVDDLATAAWHLVSGAIDAIGHFFGLGGDSDDWKVPPQCADPNYAKNVFANDYLACLPAAANAGGPVDTSSMNSACVADLDVCINPKNRGKSNEASTCGNAMAGSLKDLASQVGAAMGTAADLYQNSIGPASYVTAAFKTAKNQGLAYGVQKDMPDFCDPQFWIGYNTNATKFISAEDDEIAQCVSFVKRQFPSGNPNALPKACGALKTSSSNSQADSACFRSFVANINASKAMGMSLTGPGSIFCKAQEDLIKNNPCRFTGPDILIDPQRGIWIHDVTSIRCNNNVLTGRSDMPWNNPILSPTKGGGDTLKRPPWADTGPGGIISILNKGGGVANSPVGSSGISTSRPFGPDIPVTFPGQLGGGHGPVLLPPRLPLGGPLETPPRPPITAGLPKGGGGSSGVSMVNGCSGNAPAAGCPPTTKSGSGSGKSGGGSSGVSMVNGNSGNAPSTKSGTSKSGGSSGVSMVNGNSGNAPSTKSSTSKSGGSSGVSMINGNSGNASRLSPAFRDTPHMAPIISARPPVSSSGTNSAMDRLGGGSIGGVSGGGGGAARRPGTSFGTGSNTFKTITLPPPRNDPNDLHVR